MTNLETETKIATNTHALDVAIQVKDWDTARILWARLLGLYGTNHVAPFQLNEEEKQHVTQVRH